MAEAARKAKAPTFIAQLGAYDAPWLQGANDALWSALARRLGASGLAGVPPALDRIRPMETAWVAPDLLLAQACGYPLVTELAGRVRLVATPRYASPFAKGILNRSAVVVRSVMPWTELADLRSKVVALNAWNSNSGMNLLRAAVAPLARDTPFFSAVRLTGSHLASMAAVAAGEADVAAVDGITMALTARHRPDLVQGLRVIAATPEAPGLPLVTRSTACDREVGLLRAALDGLIEDSALRDVRQALGLIGFSHTTLADYDRILALERDAASLGYHRLA